MGFESIVAQINSLPPFPKSVIRLEDAFQQGDPDMKTILSIIEGDPQLTANILAKANAPEHGFKNTIITVMQAVTLFGLNTVRALALKTAMERNFEIDMSPYNITNEEFSKVSAMQNALMFQWYMGVDVAKAKSLIPLAFIMEIGKVLIAKELIENSEANRFSEELNEKESIGEAEYEAVGLTSAQVCALLFKHWNLDELFVALMENCDRTEDMDLQLGEMVLAINAVREAVNVKEQLSDASIEAGGEVVRGMGLDPLRFTNAARRVREKLQ